MLPIIGIGGQAGAGKDTVAGMMMKLQPGSVAIAQANPLKWLGLHGFGFTESQLWGPSETRNAVDTRYIGSGAWATWRTTEEVLFETDIVRQWVSMVGIGDVKSLQRWYDDLVDEFTTNEKFSPRLMLQQLGTEYARDINPNIWSELGIKTAIKLLQGGHTYTHKGGLVSSPTAPPASMVFITDLRFPNEVIGIKSIGGKVLKVEASATTIATTHASEASLSQVPDFWWDVILYNNKSYGLEALKQTALRVFEQLVPRPLHDSVSYRSSHVLDED